jgi:hypothetical protein
MFINNYFPTTIWSEEKPEFVKSLNKASNKYIADARKREKEYIKKYGDFGRSYHSTPLTMDNNFLDFRNYIGQKSWEYLDHQGYFLKCSDKTSYPIFHEPKTGARCTKLKMKPDLKGVWAGHEQFHIKPKPGTLIIFPGYLEHEYAVDHGIEPFRFIHWNIQAVPKEMAKDV